MIKGKTIALTIISAFITVFCIVGSIAASQIPNVGDPNKVKLAGGYIGVFMLLTIFQMVLAFPLLRRLGGKSGWLKAIVITSILPIGIVTLACEIYYLFSNDFAAERQIQIGGTA